MKAVMISIRPEWSEKILCKKKTLEIRKTRPKLETPFTCYIYQTRRRWIYKILPWLADRQAKVIAEFICDNVAEINIFMSDPKKFKPLEVYGTGMTDRDIIDYLGDRETGYSWHISNLKVYEKPKTLSSFRSEKKGMAGTCQIDKAPQSWCYVEKLEENDNGET